MAIDVGLVWGGRRKGQPKSKKVKLEAVAGGGILIESDEGKSTKGMFGFLVSGEPIVHRAYQIDAVVLITQQTIF